MDRLSGDENHGYTRSIQDIIEFFDYINPNLDKELLQLILEGRANIRDNIDGGFVRYNARKQNFEYYIPERKNK